MAIVRLAQSGFDSRFNGEFISEESRTDNNMFVTGGFTGTYGLDTDVGDSSFGFGFSPVSQLRAGCWFKHNSAATLTSGHVPIFIVRKENSALKHAIRWYTTQDQISLLVDDTIIETVCGSVIKFNRPNHWKHLGIHIKSGADGFFSFYVNGVQIFNHTGNMGSDFCAVFFPGQDNTSGNWTSAVLDDMYVDSTVGEDDGPAPAIRFYPSLPVGTGEDHGWEPVGESATFQCVLNAPLTESELAFANAADLVDTHLMTNVADLLGQKVHAVIPYVICRKTDPSIDSKILVHLFDGTLYEQSAEFQPGVGFSHFWDRQDTQPDTTAWDETAANAVEMGYESAGDFV